MIHAVEATLAGHPDKLCDQIADALVDEYIKRDTRARVDINVLGSRGMIMIGGEVQSNADFDCSEFVKKTYREIGYNDDIEVFVNVEPPSSQMLQAKQGVANTAVINGYATSETRERMPRAVVFAQNTARRIDDLRKFDPGFSWLQPDGKVQIVMQQKKTMAVTLLISHTDDIDTSQVRTAMLERVIEPLFGGDGLQVFINPIGLFTQVGLNADSGANGRKMGVDTYGGLIPHGDSAFSGKDPFRCERAGAYMARYAARWVVEQELAAAALVRVVYTMGRAEPVHVDAQGIGIKSKGAKMDISAVIKKQFDFRPDSIVERLQLFVPIYRQTACYGHFGRAGFPWEEEV